MLQESRSTCDLHSFHYNSFLIHLFFEISLIRHVLETTFRHITNGDTAELVINKETLERTEELMQYFKGPKFVLLKVYNFINTGLDIIFFNPIRFEQRKGE